MTKKQQLTTVKELKEFLKDINDEANVLFSDGDEPGCPWVWEIIQEEDAVVIRAEF